MTVKATPYSQQQLDIERFKPSCWDDIIGNHKLKDYFFDMIWCVRKEGHRSGFNLLATGGSREGKTSLISFGIKCLLCCNFDYDTMNPCHTCVNCKTKVSLFGTGGWNNQVDLEDPESNPTPVRFHYNPIDCTRLKEADLDEMEASIRVDDGTLKIVYLDEIHRLVRRNIDEMLLKPVEDYEVIWLASSAVIKKENGEDSNKLEKMFQNRFTYRLQTEKPQSDEMLSWLIDRCEQFGIKVESPEQTLNELIKQSQRVTGMALQVLNKAHKKRSKLLSLKMVEDHVFDFDD